MDIHLTEATIAKLDLEPDDVIVLRVTDPTWKPTQHLVDQMRRRVIEVCGDHEVLVLGAGLELEIVHPRDPT